MASTIMPTWENVGLFRLISSQKATWTERLVPSLLLSDFYSCRDRQVGNRQSADPSFLPGRQASSLRGGGLPIWKNVSIPVAPYRLLARCTCAVLLPPAPLALSQRPAGNVDLTVPATRHGMSGRLAPASREPGKETVAKKT